MVWPCSFQHTDALVDSHWSGVVGEQTLSLADTGSVVNGGAGWQVR